MISRSGTASQHDVARSVGHSLPLRSYSRTVAKVHRMRSEGHFAGVRPHPDAIRNLLYRREWRTAA